MDDQTSRLLWPASGQFAFAFELIYGQDGRFKALRCDIRGRHMRFQEEGYLLPLSLKALDGNAGNVDIHMELMAGQPPYERAVWCRIDVPDFRFEGVAFMFSEQVNGFEPLTIW